MGFSHMSKNLYRISVDTVVLFAQGRRVLKRCASLKSHISQCTINQPKEVVWNIDTCPTCIEKHNSDLAAVIFFKVEFFIWNTI